jgi:AcrR family transcriptional regulator
MLAHEMRTRSSTAGGARHAILVAARQVIMHQGVPKLTLEAVAAQAGISKGGLLYHFPTKEAMLHGLLLQHHCAILEACREQFLSDPAKTLPGRMHRAWVRAVRAGIPEEEDIQLGDIAAIVTNPALSAPLQVFWTTWGALLHNDGLDEEDTLLIQITLAGLKMVRTLGSCLAKEQHDKLLDRLERMATPKDGYKQYDETCTWDVCASDAWKGK